MIVEFSIYPVGSEHFSDKIAKVVNVLERRNVEFQVGPMGTSLRGTWDEVMPAIRECHEMLARGGERVITSLTIDDRREDTHDLKERVETVARKAAS